MENCVFCQIVSGNLPSYKVYEDKKVLAFLNIHPINKGHILVIPKKHEPNFYNLDDSNYHAVMGVVKKMSLIVNKKMKPKKVGLIVAGWDVPHTHIHIVPMKGYHDITSKSLLEGKQSNPSSKKLNEILAKLRG